MDAHSNSFYFFIYFSVYASEVILDSLGRRKTFKGANSWVSQLNSTKTLAYYCYNWQWHNHMHSLSMNHSQHNYLDLVWFKMSPDFAHVQIGEFKLAEREPSLIGGL